MLFDSTFVTAYNCYCFSALPCLQAKPYLSSIQEQLLEERFPDEQFPVEDLTTNHVPRTHLLIL